jgi:type IV pilus assembly protein PilY1
MKLWRSSVVRKCCAALVAVSLALQPASMYATSLAELPLQGLNPVQPNIMYTLDDSTSMSWDFLPDYELNGSFCRDSNGAAVFCQVSVDLSTSQDDPNPPNRSSNFNRIYYDPAIDYTVGVRGDSSTPTLLPCEGTNTRCDGPWTSVYTDGFAGYPGTNSSPTIKLTTAYPDVVYCWKATTDPSDWATAKSNGSVCRYNGVAYGSALVAGVTTTAIAAGYNYPNAATTSCPDDATTKCVFGNRQPITGNPYYYTISSVQFCASPDPAGWGTGSCGPKWLPSTTTPNAGPYVSYGAGGFDASAFKRIDIVPSTTVYPSGRSYAEEMANFAKWYTFNRTRILAMKTAGGAAFSVLGPNGRVGFNTINTYLSNFLNVVDFTPTNKTAWFSNFYSVTPSGSTPTIDAMVQIGQYFANADTALPGDNIFLRPRPALPGAVDPLKPETGKCQPNYHLLATDGFWNQRTRIYGGVPSIGPINDQDLTVPDLPSPVPGLTPGQPFPAPFQEDPSHPTSNVMADVAMYYWIHDLRPELPDKVQLGTAPWQNVTFYALSIGAEGTLAYPGALSQILAGTSVWPAPVNDDPTGTDDLWHAALNGHGQFNNVQNAQQLADAIAGAVANFTASQAGTGTSVGISGAQLTAATSFAYKTSYEVGWWGDVKKFALDSTGALPLDANGNPLNAPVWAAAPQVDIQAAGTGWNDGLNRRIVMLSDVSNSGAPFRLASLSAAQQNSLVAGWSPFTGRPPTAQAVLNFLRGDRSNEGTAATNFRIRSHILGDFVNSAAVPVGAPSQQYTDPGYAAFASSKQSRTPMVYAGGNDGMLHVFDDSNTASAGKEAWAYVPRALFSSVDPNGIDPNPSAFQIGALAFRTGGLPTFKHAFYVNATPRVWDVDFANTDTATPPQTGNDWRTMVIGGLGAGGRAVYALDATTPVSATDTEAAVASSGRVLWEFTDGDLGYVYDSPTLVKTYAYGWVALVPSGYNTPTGKGFLYVLNPTNGRILQKLSLPGDPGNSVNQTGLSIVRAFTANRKNPYALQAYSGDLNGNVWRFDLSDANPANWGAKVELIAQLTDPNGHAQPITTGVRIEIDQTNGNRYLFVGTGKLLDAPDLTDTSVTNTLYVIRDGTVASPDPKPTTPYSRTNGLTNSVNGTTVAGFSSTAIGRGWYQDAVDPSTGQLDPNQKIITDITADLQTVVFVFSKPSSDPCVAALTSFLYARNFTTGNSELESTGGEIVPSITDIGAIAGVTLIQSASASTTAASNVRAQVTTMSGQVLSFGVRIPGTVDNRHRVSWRLLNRD